MNRPLHSTAARIAPILWIGLVIVLGGVLIAPSVPAAIRMAEDEPSASPTGHKKTLELRKKKTIKPLLKDKPAPVAPPAAEATPKPALKLLKHAPEPAATPDQGAKGAAPLVATKSEIAPAAKRAPSTKPLKKEARVRRKNRRKPAQAAPVVEAKAKPIPSAPAMPTKPAQQPTALANAAPTPAPLATPLPPVLSGLEPTAALAKAEVASPAPSKPRKGKVRLVEKPVAKPSAKQEMAAQAKPAAPQPGQGAPASEKTKRAQEVRAAAPVTVASAPAQAPVATRPVVLDGAVQSALKDQPSAETLARLRQLLIARRDNPAATQVLLLRIGEVALALKNPGEALLAYRSAYKDAPNPRVKRQAGEALAQAAVSAGDYKLAARQWATLRATMPELANDPRALNAQALALVAQNDFAGANALWSQAPTAALAGGGADQQAQVLLGQALACELQGRHEEARKRLVQIIQDDYATPESALARKRLADLEEPLTR